MSEFVRVSTSELVTSPSGEPDVYQQCPVCGETITIWTLRHCDAIIAWGDDPYRVADIEEIGEPSPRPPQNGGADERRQ